MARVSPLLVVLYLASPAAAQEEKFSEPHIRLYKKVAPAVVHIRGGGQKGSGVIIHPSGIVLTSPTACGVSTDSATVRTHLHRDYSAKVLGRVNELELAILKIEGDAPFPYVPIGDSSAVRLGQLLYSFGDSFDSLYRDAQVHMSLGVVSGRYDIAVVKSPRSRYKGPVLETSAAVNQNQNGGPLVDRRGRLVGLITLNYHDAKFTGVAVPINLHKRHILRIAPTLEGVVGLPRRGEAWIGVSCRETEEGLLVRAVYSDGPAGRGGVRKGDFIVAFDGKEIRSMAHLQSCLSSVKPGDHARVFVLRGGKRVALSLTVTKKPIY